LSRSADPHPRPSVGPSGLSSLGEKVANEANRTVPSLLQEETLLHAHLIVKQSCHFRMGDGPSPVAWVRASWGPVPCHNWAPLHPTWEAQVVAVVIVVVNVVASSAAICHGCAYTCANRVC
jgi:hypothetical protein